MAIKNVIEKYNNTNLVLKIIAGIIFGSLLALVIPNNSWIVLLGKLFVGALKAIAPILVFVLVVTSLALGAKKPDGRFRTVIGLYLFSTFLAAVVSVLFSFLFPQKLALTPVAPVLYSVPHTVTEIIQNLLVKIVINPLSSLAEGNYLGILFWSIIFGFALKEVATDGTKVFLQNCSEGISKVVIWIINFAPIGILGLVFDAVSKSGIDIFTEYGKLLTLLVGSMLFVCLVTNPMIVAILIKQNPYPLIFRCLKESGVTAFFTRSSAANIPVNMSLCEKLGLDKEMYSVSIPLGATINMSGAAVTITIMTLATAYTMGINVPFVMAIILCLLSTLGACGASGIAGGSLLLIPMACSLFGITNDIAVQVVGVGFIVGVIQDSMETALNSSSDVVFTASAEYFKKKLNVKGN